MDGFNYVGDNVCVEEMLQGCIISADRRYIVISSPRDAIEVIRSLLRMLKIQFPDYEHGIIDSESPMFWTCPKCYETNHGHQTHCWRCENEGQ